MNDENQETEPRDLRLGWLGAGILLLGYQAWSLPDLIWTVQHPNQRHGFEVDIAWLFLYANPLVAAISALMIWRAFQSR